MAVNNSLRIMSPRAVAISHNRTGRPIAGGFYSMQGVGRRMGGQGVTKWGERRKKSPTSEGLVPGSLHSMKEVSERARTRKRVEPGVRDATAYR